MKERKTATKSKRRVPDWQILKLIDQGYNQAQIAKTLKISPQAVNKRVKKFLNRKWVTISEAATKDARQLNLTNEKIFTLTPTGKAHLLLRGEKIEDLTVLKEIVKDLENLMDKYEFIYELKSKEKDENTLR